MPKKIDHEGRQVKILKTAIKVFAREGYRDSNLSLIAEECGISRPTLYQYFKDKDDIFYYAVKYFTGLMFARYSVIAWDESKGDQIERITIICEDIVDYALENSDVLRSLVDVMVQLKKEYIDFSVTIMKRTAKLSILIKRLLGSGIREGKISPSCDIDMVTQHLFILLESYCLQIAFLGNLDRGESKRFLATYLSFYRASK